MCSKGPIKETGYKTLRDLGRILSVFNSFDVDEISITEIAKSVHMDPSKVSRMVTTLVAEGFFEKNPDTRKYRLGIGLLDLGILFLYHHPLRKIIRPHLEQMTKDLNLVSGWSILKNDRVIVMDRVQSQDLEFMSFHLGFHIPIHATSPGKIFLAYASTKERNRILNSVTLKKFTSRTITDLAALIKELRLTKKRGYSSVKGEAHDDLSAIAAPVLDKDAKVIAAINLMGAKSRLGTDDLTDHANYLKEKVKFVSRQLGYTYHI